MAGEKAEAKQTAAPSKSGIDDNLLGALCYIPIIFIGLIVSLYVLLTEKKQNRFLAFHAWQALLLMVIMSIICVGLIMVLGVMSMVLAVFTAGFGMLLMPCVGLVLLVVLLVVFLFPAWKAYQGERYKLPVIGDFAEKQANK